MAGSRPVNKFRGRVAITSKNREEIAIRLENGGIVVCDNHGFKQGDEVCVILDALNLQVRKVMDAEHADVQVLIGKDPYIQTVLHKPSEVVDDDDEMPSFTPEIESYLKEAIENGPNEDDFYVDLRQDAESVPDRELRGYGDEDEEWHGELEF
jgi:hypothetical protein